MKADKETVIVLLIAGLILLGWFIYFPKYQKAKELERIQLLEQVQQQKSVESVPDKPAAPAPVQQVTAAAKEETPAKAEAETRKEAPAKEKVSDGKKDFNASPLKLSNGLAEAVIDPVKGAVVSVRLLNYAKASDKNECVVLWGEDETRHTFEITGLGDVESIDEVKQLSPSSAVVTRSFSGVTVTQTFTLIENSYKIVCKIKIFSLGTTVPVSDLVVWNGGVPPLAELSGDKVYSERHNVDYCLAGEHSAETIDPSSKDAKYKDSATSSSVAWTGATNKYFASLMFPDKLFDGGITLDRKVRISPTTEKEYYTPYIGGVFKGRTIVPGSDFETTVVCYAGPKEISRIKELPETAMEVMHISWWSWFEFIARPLVKFLVWLESKCGSYGIAIILLTVIVRLIFWPVTQRANTSMRKMQKLSPKIKELRERFKDNPQEMNTRMMELYRQEKVSPLGGCLPILLQLPVFFALYSALDAAVELRQVSFLWITDLTKPDLIGPTINLPLMGNVGFHPLVIAMTLLMLLQQKMTPSNAEPSQQKIMMAMPIIMLFMFYSLPSGLTLYWTVSQIFSIIQLKYGQIVAEREEAAEKSAAGNGSKNNKKR